ncbi:adenosylcobinamide-GDP ribazoletransferase [Silvimonas amylolytica]|uniref:Adenosylcobinamide-GDP ribazoletransferase n=1 Tax=Silvimonas amylolytica TaxID=449663 RepID=A0ABQ2PLU1_9NEIS|nr:adenosylcobinamide-GDP ribazoletransferase [Silvimonas amylolytica]GGP26584.1 adenosylcobinamide-GDP ribazoletransferase [Silvimonas amylolytica]
MNAANNPIRHFFCALGYFTRIPIPAWVGYLPDDLDRAARYFPLVGVLIGVIAAAVFWLTHWVLPMRVALVLSMIATIWLTGAFHEDGLADAVDGFGGGYTRERMLEIMHDSRIGSFGAIALIAGLLLKLETLAALPVAQLGVALIAAHGFSRLVAVSLLATLDYVRPAGKAKPVATRLAGSGLLLAIVFGVVPLLLLPPLWIGTALLAGIMVRYGVAAYLRKTLGGYTGDTLGMTQQLAELACYLAWCACVLR